MNDKDRDFLLSTIESLQEQRDAMLAAVGETSQPPKPRGSITEAIAALRAAGGDAWDDIDDPEEFLGRKKRADP